MMIRRHRGFTLVEASVAIAILIVIIAIALPQFTRMLMLRNEAAVIEGLRTVVQACESWRSQGITATVGGFPPTLTALATAQPPYLDQRFRALGGGGAPMFGYTWTYAVGPPSRPQVGNVAYLLWNTYTLRANPVLRGVTGQRSFYTDQTGVVRFELNGPAGPASAALEQTQS